MRSSDWSSDVCPSDLRRQHVVERILLPRHALDELAQQVAVHGTVLQALDDLLDAVLQELAQHVGGGLVGHGALVEGLHGQQAGGAQSGRPPGAAGAGLWCGNVTQSSWVPIRSEEHTSELQSL